ncbi:MAG: molybdopterin-guanine dinucleotide biosynthesis protein B, partial [Gemmatimonadota bacterium]
MESRHAPPPAVSIVGRKNSGKTTLLVALAAELKRRGRRIATLKHGHPHFEIDRPGSDTWRHKHEGAAEAVLMASSAKLALIADVVDGEPDPRELIAWAFGGRGCDLVLIEGYKHGPFPKVEVFRRAEHDGPIHDPREPEAAGLIAVVSDDPA